MTKPREWWAWLPVNGGRDAPTLFQTKEEALEDFPDGVAQGYRLWKVREVSTKENK